MTNGWNDSGGDAYDTDDDWSTASGKFGLGIDAALTLNASATDPSVGATETWGADQVGRPWWDIGVDGSAASPVLKIWQQLTSSPTYGWRRMRLPKLIWLDTPKAVTFTSTSPAGSDVPWEDVDLVTALDASGSQDTGQVASRVKAVCLQVRCKTGASETIVAGTSEPYIAFRAKSGSQDSRVSPQVQNLPMEQQVWVPLDSAEVMQFMVTVGGGTPGFIYEAWIIGIEEEI